MTNYLLVECIVDNLVHGGIINPPNEAWKKTAIGTQFYYADFFHAGTGSIFSFRVSVVDGNHVISVTAFVNQAKFFRINPVEILADCKL